MKVTYIGPDDVFRVKSKEGEETVVLVKDVATDVPDWVVSRINAVKTINPRRFAWFRVDAA